MTKPGSLTLLALALSTFALLGAPCPLGGGEPLECEGDNDCDDDEECNDGECDRVDDEDPDPVGPSARERELCIVAYTCAGDADPAATCDRAAADASGDPAAACVRVNCATELAAFVNCALELGACVDGIYDYGVNDACADQIDRYGTCAEDAGCNDVTEGTEP